MKRLIYLIFVIFLIIQISYSNILKEFNLTAPVPPAQFALLSCKLDAFHYGLTLILDHVPSMSWFVEKLPCTKTHFFSISQNGVMEISDPLVSSPGSIHGQQARFDDSNRLFFAHGEEAVYTIWDRDGLLDNFRLEQQYGKMIGFGIDNRLIARTYGSYLLSQGIAVNFIDASGMDKKAVRDELVRIITAGGIIVCNGIVQGFGEVRVYSFTIKNSRETYKWKEASHSYVLIGYNLDRNTFKVADNFGSLENPYTPTIYDLNFDTLYYQITLLDPASLDYTIVLSKSEKAGK